MKFLKRRAFSRRLKRIPREVRKQVEKDLNTGADEMVDVARRFVPKDDLTLANSIRKEQGKRPLRVVVKAGGASTTKPVRNGASGSYDYALGQEFGTQKTPAQPYFWPAYRLIKKRAGRRVTRNANKIIKRIFKK